MPNTVKVRNDDFSSDFRHLAEAAIAQVATVVISEKHDWLTLSDVPQRMALSAESNDLVEAAI
ncbi:hypothetical protein [Rhodopseudomonas sp. BR0C11]|uniref:hypothetical protein n=1 Tax=Rhodopseudomonas sp. BR0C11 TaxID=2269370 RepID=UPI0013DF8FF1|nr:hypothetical protein [Rhodopseudomonas sp. BR0C11]